MKHRLMACVPNGAFSLLSSLGETGRNACLAHTQECLCSDRMRSREPKHRLVACAANRLSAGCLSGEQRAMPVKVET